MGPINLLLAGKSGVGKSSLINYLFKAEVAKTGSGTAQTKRVINKYTIQSKEQNFILHDTWGVEPGENWDRWISDFEKYCNIDVANRDCKSWMHGVVYCISSKGGRIEDSEIDTINKIIDFKLKPILVLTKCDNSNCDEFASYIEQKTGIKPIQVCSVEKSQGLGRNKLVIKPYGRDDVFNQIKSTAINQLKHRLSKIANACYKDELLKVISSLPDIYESVLERNSTFGYVSKEKAKYASDIIKRKITAAEKRIKIDVQDLIDDVTRNYGTMMGNFNANSIGFDKINAEKERSFIEFSDVIGIGLLEAVTIFLGPIGWAGGLFFLGKKFLLGEIKVNKSVAEMRRNCAELKRKIEATDEFSNLKNEMVVG